MRSGVFAAGFFACAAFNFACGSADPGAGPGGGQDGGPTHTNDAGVTTVSLFPLAVGYSWTYDVTEPGRPVGRKTQSVTATTTHQGKPAFVLFTKTEDHETTSIQLMDGSLLLRASEIEVDSGTVDDRVRFVPPAIRIDTKLLPIGSVYTSVFTEEHLDESGSVLSRVDKEETFTIEKVDDVIVTPAGTFRTVRVLRAGKTGPPKTFWFAPGVGKVREIGAKTEVLVEARTATP